MISLARLKGFCLAASLFMLAALPMVAEAQYRNCNSLYTQRFTQGYGYRYNYAAPAVVHHYHNDDFRFEAGESIRQDAVATKAAEKVLGEIRKELEALKALKGQVAAQGSLASTSVIAQKCVRCHSGENAEAGVELNGKPLTRAQKWRIVEMIGSGKDVPAKMKGLVEGLKGEERGAITFELSTSIPDAPDTPAQPQPSPQEGTLQ